MVLNDVRGGRLMPHHPIVSFIRLVGAEAKAEDLRTAILELLRRNGFREYFEPHGTAGYGSDRFSWTAALCLDVALGG